MIRCTFAGHRDICGVQAEDITEVLEEIIQYTESPIECFVGGMGKFDNLCAAAVRLLKRQYREKEISLILVLPYLQKRINVNSAYYETTISEIDTNEKGDPVTMTSTKNKIVHTIQEELNEKYYQLMYGKKTYISSNQSLS